MDKEQIFELMRDRLFFCLFKLFDGPQEINRTIEKAIRDYIDQDFSFEKVSSFFKSCDETELQSMRLKQGLSFVDKTDLAMDILNMARCRLPGDIPR